MRPTPKHDDKIEITEEQLSPRERTVLAAARRRNRPVDLDLLAALAYPDDPEGRRLRTRHALPRLLAGGFLRKIVRGIYEAVRQAAPDLRTQALRRIANGEAERAVARDLKIPRSTINDWRRKGATPVQTEARP